MQLHAPSARPHPVPKAEVALDKLPGPTRSDHPKSQSSQETYPSKELHPVVQRSSSELHHFHSNPAARENLPLQGQATQGRARRGTTTRTNISIDNNYPNSHPLPASIVKTELSPWEGEHWVLHSDPRLSMTPQAEADSPPTRAPGSPDLFSRPRPRPPRSPSQAAKIRAQNRRRQYLENNPEYLSSADNQLAGKPQVMPAP